VKVGIMLEETGLAYEPHRIDIAADESHDPAFLALNPNDKNPGIYDPDGPSGAPLALFESGAILLYLADKTGQFISGDPNTRYETIQWVMWQMGGVAPMFGQVGFFNKFAGKAMRTSGRATATQPNARGCSASLMDGSRGAIGSWALTTASPIFAARLGAPSDRPLRSARDRRL
jgi:glutathione S-transferase